VASLVAVACASAGAAEAAEPAGVAGARITARVTTDRVDNIALHGKQRNDGDWAAKADIVKLPCAGPHRLHVVTRVAGSTPNLHTSYALRVARPRVRSGRARCGHPVPARYGNRRAAVRLAPRRALEAPAFGLTGRRMWNDGPFELRLRFSTFACAGRYTLRIRMDGPREPLRVRYRARVGAPSIGGQPQECGS
jgi:hypothetical protein